MRTTSSNRTRKRANAAESQDIQSVSAPSVPTHTGRLERKQEIGRTISEAMSKLPEIDWSRESEGITQAQCGLDEAMMQFVEGRVSKLDVKAAYKPFVNAHRGGLF